ncbi:putative transcriptional regulator [Gluconacetobacter johannae DSM 13595]|uniref:Putative addiction module antidote protein n=1 Tax=Gluconacetobacter johannae TaxID=112140 RepID=A0A7W4J7K4_9PROT|nr:addiction module antidote protein [Gluconacetobacter johannae]MBB2176176.1 putative addiction module antidote protein [Gluconacetobacter johannae]GBQ89291.1 putative transcriptional regulator [Gluconacetobacter johannae DSM 13595]
MTHTRPFDPAKYLTRPEAQEELLNEALESGDAAFIAQTLGVIARARGISQIAKDTGLTRQGIYKALDDNGDPRLTTLLGVLKSLGFSLKATTA